MHKGRTRAIAAASVLGLMTGVFTAVSVGLATGASAAVPPVVQRPATAVTADGLPTAQINGVVWSMAIAGNTVYAGGEFTRARPPGSAPGQNEIVRNNLVAFNLTTGALATTFAPSLNAKVSAVAVSPDKTRVYVAGPFTSADGQVRNRVAAYSVATGALIPSFAPNVNGSVTSLAVTDSTVYLGGFFSAINGSGRTRLGAVTAASGALVAWKPTADYDVDSMVLSPDRSRVIIGGKFNNVSGQPAARSASLDAVTGARMPWALSSVVAPGSVLALSADDTAIYGSTFTFGGGNFEGNFSANPSDGSINWLDDCHGDTYDATSVNGVVYSVGHPHFCKNIGGFPDTNPRMKWYRGMAFTKTVGGTVQTNTQGGYWNLAGQPAPSIVNWFPDLVAGSYTGSDQAAWSLASTDKYVVAGGEFPVVNGKSQQGLVRFAVSSLAPNKIGPEVADASWPITTASVGSSIRVTFPANWDRDDQALTYSVYRSDRGGTPIYTTTAVSQFWNRPNLSFSDTGYTNSATYTYTVRASDPSGNVKTSAASTITAPASGGTPLNPLPVPAFSYTTSGLTGSFDATASTDNGSIASCAWNYGDGSTGSGCVPSHPYAVAGTYQVTLTVTDNQGAPATLTKPVTIGGGGASALDTFTRSVMNSWGSADIGGAWTLTSPLAFSTDGSTGKIALKVAGDSPSAVLSGISQADVDVLGQVSVDKVQTGSGGQAMLVARKVGKSDYRLKARFLANGRINLVLSRLVNGAETFINEVNSGVTFAPGDVMNLRFVVSGANPTSLAGRVWKTSSAEPATPQITASDAQSALQGPGSVGVAANLAANVTNAPVVITVDNLTVR